MNHQNPPPLLHVQTTFQILTQTTTIVFSTRRRFFISLLLSYLLFSFKLGTQFMTDLYNSSIDDDRSIKTHFAQIQNSTTHLTGTGADAGDFNSEISHQFVINRPTESQLNATPFTLDSYIPKLGFSKLKEFSFKLINNHGKADALSKPDDESKNDQDFTGLHLYLNLDFVAIYVTAFFGFLFTRSCIHGVIFFLLVNALLRIHNSILATFWTGTELGFSRLNQFISIKCLVRLLLAQLLAVIFHGKIADPHTNYKAFVRLRFMPFLMDFPPIKGFEEGIDGFMLSWILLEMLMSVVFAMSACDSLVHPRRTFWDSLREGCYLLSLNVYPTIWFKVLDIASGSVATFVFGELFGFVIQSLIEVYFRVALMMYYFSVRSMDANSKGQPFGQREFEIMRIR